MSTNISRICKNSDAIMPAAGGCEQLRGQTVCVTGAGGFIASWLVKTLLLKGYNVRGTLRNPEDPKNSHLEGFEGAKERLKLFKADVLELESLVLQFEGCDGVFHVASPMTNDPEKVKVAVEGTKNAVKTAADAGVRRLVFTSSVGAMHMNPSRRPDAVLNEECWSDLDYCKKTGNWYCYAKMMAELVALKMAKERGLDLVVVAPPVTVGPVLQSTLTPTTIGLLNYITGRKKTYPNAMTGLVDVRDVAQAHVLVYECPTLSGRYFCIETVLHRGQVLRMISDMFPEYPITTKCSDMVNPSVKPWKFSNKKLKDLGLEYTPIKRSLYETVKSMQEKGHLPPPHMLHVLPKIPSSL